jgi:hypothetical protein
LGIFGENTEGVLHGCPFFMVAFFVLEEDFSNKYSKILPQLCDESVKSSTFSLQNGNITTLFYKSNNIRNE